MTVERIEAPGVRNPAPRTMPGRSNWWIQPVAIAVGFTLFVIYSTISIVFLNASSSWHAGPYLSPFYSPLLKFGWWPLSSAILVAWVPLSFRATCYYYRKAYYRAFFWDPPSCAIREPSGGVTHLRSRYLGERRFPWILNNLHRFFLYLALVVLAVLWIDTVTAFYWNGGLYIGIGSVFMLVNVILLTMYTFSCHALRHLVGGSVDCFSCSFAGRQRRGLWRLVTKINPYHGTFAWFSLVSVAAVDFYIRLVAGGALGHCIGTHFGC